MPSIDETKRRKTVLTKQAKSKIFSPFRVLGNVSNQIPFAVGTLGQTFYIVTSVGRSFQIYDANTLHLLFVSQNQMPCEITSLSAHFHHVYVSYGNKVGIFKRGRLEDEVSFQLEENDCIKGVSVFGDYLVAYSSDSVFVCRKGGNRFATQLHTEFRTSNLDGGIVSIVHPPTFLNKVVVASTTNLKVYNVRTGKHLYTSEDFAQTITALECCPVLDFVAMGFADGTFSLYNIRKGRVVRSVSTGIKSPVTSISFRTDGSPHAVTSHKSGDLFFYDLDRKARIHTLSGAHKEMYGGVSRAHFLNNQAVIVTSGADNQLKEYVFDPSLSEGIVSPPRHLRSRGGHSAPPSSVSFADSHFMLSASKDRSFWSFSLRKDAQSQEMSQRPQKSVKKTAGPTLREKFSEMLCMAHSNARAGEWENVLSAHQDEQFARTWNTHIKRVGRWQLATIDQGMAKSVAISHCGNFGLVGSSLGGIGVYNLQSGTLKRKYTLHKKAVTGLAIDSMNCKMVSVGLDGVVGFYHFSKAQFLGKLQLDAPITQMVYHKGSDLIAAALDDLSVVVIDVVTRKVVRVLYGHSNRITSLDFSPDARWIVSASLDSTLRTWDLPSGGCIDGIVMPSVVTCVKFSPQGDTLATAHVAGVGIALWNNRAQFHPVSTRIVEEADFSRALLPNVSGENAETIIDGAMDENVQDEVGVYTSADTLGPDLVALSLAPRSKFNSLLYLDVIRQRNAPKEAPKKSDHAPFFLDLKGEKVGDQAIVAEDGLKQEESGSVQSESKLRKLDSSAAFESAFTEKLRTAAESEDFTAFLEHLLSLPLSATDLEIRCLNTQPPFDELVAFINALTFGLTSNKNYDLMQAYMAVFLRCHGDVVYHNGDGLVEALEEWDNANKGSGSKMDELVKYCAGVSSFLSTV